MWLIWTRRRCSSFIFYTLCFLFWLVSIAWQYWQLALMNWDIQYPIQSYHSHPFRCIIFVWMSQFAIIASQYHIDFEHMDFQLGNFRHILCNYWQNIKKFLLGECLNILCFITMLAPAMFIEYSYHIMYKVDVPEVQVSFLVAIIETAITVKISPIFSMSVPWANMKR